MAGRVNICAHLSIHRWSVAPQCQYTRLKLTTVLSDQTAYLS